MISIVLPVVRPEKAKNCIELLKDCGVVYELITEVDNERIGCPKMVKKLVSQSKYDLVCFIGDDCLPQKDFLKHALEEMNSFPDQWGLVGLNDGTGRVDLPTHWLAHKKLLDYCEDRDFFYTGYTHCYCDMELRDIAKGLNRYVYCEKAMVKHDHPALTGEPTSDPDYVRVYNPEVKLRDMQLYYERKLKTKDIKCFSFNCPKCNKELEIVYHDKKS